MNLDKLTIKTQEAIQSAQQIAMENEHQAIETAHILKGILNVDENVTPYILSKLSVNRDILEKALDSIIKSFPKVSGGNFYLSQNANKAIQTALSGIKKTGDEFVSIERLLLSLFDIGDQASQVMKDSGITKDGLEKAISELRKGEKVIMMR